MTTWQAEEPSTRPRPPRRWRDKFAEALRGVRVGAQGQSSFYAHFFFACLAVLAAVVLECDRVEWCLVVGCVGLVFTAELFNTAIETLFKGLDPAARDRVYHALDISAGAVLVTCLTAAVVGGFIFGRKLLVIFGTIHP
jgi:diacylglycerol kinase